MNTFIWLYSMENCKHMCFSVFSDFFLFISYHKAFLWDKGFILFHWRGGYDELFLIVKNSHQVIDVSTRFPQWELFMIGLRECKIVAFWIPMITPGFWASSTPHSLECLLQLCCTCVPPLGFILLVRVGLCRLTWQVFSWFDAAFS